LLVQKQHQNQIKENPEKQLSHAINSGDLRKKSEEYHFSAQKYDSFRISCAAFPRRIF